MFKSPVLASPILAYLLLCGACARLEVPALVKAPPPVEFADCGEQPIPPEDFTDTDVALVILDLRRWGTDCRDKLRLLYEWSKPKQGTDQ